MYDYIEQAAGFIIYNTQYRSTAVHTNEKLWNHTGAEDPPDAGHVGERPERPEGEPVLHTPQFVPLLFNGPLFVSPWGPPCGLEPPAVSWLAC